MEIYVCSFQSCIVTVTTTYSVSKTNNKKLKSKLNIKSALLTTKSDMQVNVKKDRLLSGRATVIYKVPKMISDKLVFTAKISDRSTKAYIKYNVKTWVTL